MQPLWYYAQNGTKTGPLPEDQILALLAAGTITHQTLLWTQGMEGWAPAGELLYVPQPPQVPIEPPPLPQPTAMPARQRQSTDSPNPQHASTTLRQGASIGGWICFVLGATLIAISFWTLPLSGPLLLAAFALSVSALSQKRLLSGIVLLLATLIIPPTITLWKIRFSIDRSFETAKQRLAPQMQTPPSDPRTATETAHTPLPATNSGINVSKTPISLPSASHLRPPAAAPAIEPGTSPSIAPPQNSPAQSFSKPDINIPVIKDLLSRDLRPFNARQLAIVHNVTLVQTQGFLNVFPFSPSSALFAYQTTIPQAAGSPLHDLFFVDSTNLLPVAHFSLPVAATGLGWAPESDERFILLTKEPALFVGTLSTRSLTRLPISPINFPPNIHWFETNTVCFAPGSQSSFFCMLDLQTLQHKGDYFTADSKAALLNKIAPQTTHPLAEFATEDPRFSGGVLALRNRDRSFLRGFIDNWDEVFDDYVSRPDLHSVITKETVSSASVFSAPTQRITVSFLGPVPETPWHWFVEFPWKKNLPPDDVRFITKLIDADVPILAQVYSPSVNPLNDTVIGFDPNKWKGVINITHWNEIGFYCETVFGRETILDGDIATRFDYDSDAPNSRVASGYGFPLKESWFPLKSSTVRSRTQADPSPPIQQQGELPHSAVRPARLLDPRGQATNRSLLRSEDTKAAATETAPALPTSRAASPMLFPKTHAGSISNEGVSMGKESSVERPPSSPTGAPQHLPTKDGSALHYDDALASYRASKYQEAYGVLLRLAEEGHAEAQNLLGTLYRQGLGVEKNSKEGIKWTQRAAEQGLASAQHNMGWIFAMGAGVEADNREALKWYQKSAAQGDADSLLNIGLIHAKGGAGLPQNFQEAMKWFYEAAKSGNVEACYHLGVMYCAGKGVAPDVATGLQWHEKAATQGDARSQFKLGMSYYRGNGLEKSYQEAHKWFLRAAQQNNADAQYNLFVMLFNGEGCDKDLQIAAEWLEKAAAQGQPDAVRVMEKMAKP